MDLQHEHSIEELEEQLTTYKEERERIKQFLGQIGGKTDLEHDRIVNIIFFILIILLFSFDILRHVLGLPIPLPPVLSIEIGILLISVKIIWMISRQRKVNHFQFWILNSIEFRINNLSRQLNELQDTIGNTDKKGQKKNT
ncbi:MAG: hypothetical protein U5N56_02495 [Candidatus Marinimicrobia bacterium]|nr:hypothetical protein [Candidatus Neomarinimicrobiota bacterium]